MFDSPPIVLIQFLNTESVTRKRGPPWSPCYMRKSTLEIDRYYGIVPLDPFRMQGFSNFLGLFQVTVAKPQEIFWSLPRSKEALTWLADIYVYKDICVEFFSARTTDIGYKTDFNHNAQQDVILISTLQDFRTHVLLVSFVKYLISGTV